MKKFKQTISKIVALTPEQDVFMTMHPGDEVIWEKEPTNKFDSNAIAVFSAKKEKIGYLPRPLAKEIAIGFENDSIKDISICVNDVLGNEEQGLSCNLKIDFS